MPNFVYNKGLEEIAKATTDLDAVGGLGDLRLMLVLPTYEAVAQATRQDQLLLDNATVDDALSHEVTVGGYARQALANKVVTRDDANNFAYLDADDVVFTALVAGQTVAGAVLYRHVGADTANIPIAYYDLTDTPTNGGNITIQWATPANGGVLKLASA